MFNKVTIEEKYERHGWPSIDRLDLKPPDGWSLELINSLNLIHHHELSPDGEWVAFVWERDGRSDIFAMPAAGGWPRLWARWRSARRRRCSCGGPRSG